MRDEKLILVVSSDTDAMADTVRVPVASACDCYSGEERPTVPMMRAAREFIDSQTITFTSIANDRSTSEKKGGA